MTYPDKILNANSWPIVNFESHIHMDISIQSPVLILRVSISCDRSGSRTVETRRFSLFPFCDSMCGFSSKMQIPIFFFVLTHLTTLSLTTSSLPQNGTTTTNISLRRSSNNIRTTVSGLSAGAFFSHQYHVAHSSSIDGAGIIAGGPYYCAMGNLITAQTSCMKDPSLISVDVLIDIVDRRYKTTKTIDAPENLASDRVFLFSGKNDSVVVNPQIKKNQINKN